MRLVVLALCIVVSQRAAEAEPSGPWTFAVHAGVAYEHRSGYFTFSALPYGVQLGVGHEVAPDWTLGLRIDVRPQIEIGGGGDFGKSRDLPFYNIADQTGNVVIEHRWGWLTGSAALGVRREDISGYYLYHNGPGPYIETGEELIRLGVVGSLGVGTAYYWSTLGFEARLEASASQLDDGTLRYRLDPNSPWQMKDAPDTIESGFDVALWLGMRWN